MNVKKIGALLLAATLITGSLAACAGGNQNDDTVVIFSSMEDFRNEELSRQLKTKFPDQKITVQYQPTGNSAAKLKAEGKDTECDIVLGLESAYMEQLKDQFADLSEYDTAKYVDGLNPEHNQYRTWELYNGSIIVNETVLKQKGLPTPQSYEDLLKPEYKGLIAMPNPKTSGTGYMFLNTWVKQMGEDQALSYIDKLQLNVKQFTESGSGPVNMLVNGEIAIGLGMVLQGVQQIDKQVPLKIIELSSGAPYNITGVAMISGRESNESVKAVFDFLYNEFCMYDKEYFSPGKIFKEQKTVLENYPTELKSAEMERVTDIEFKNELIAKWRY